MFPFVRVPNETNINFFLLVNYTRPLLCQFCFNWMNVDLRYEAKLLMFQSAIAWQTVRAHYFGYLVWSTDVSLCPHFDCDHIEPDNEILQKSIPHHCFFFFRSVLQKIEIR